MRWPPASCARPSAEANLGPVGCCPAGCAVKCWYCGVVVKKLTYHVVVAAVELSAGSAPGIVIVHITYSLHANMQVHVSVTDPCSLLRVALQGHWPRMYVSAVLLCTAGTIQQQQGMLSVEGLQYRMQLDGH